MWLKIWRLRIRQLASGADYNEMEKKMHCTEIVFSGEQRIDATENENKRSSEL